MNYLIPNNPFNPDKLYKLFILGCLIVLALIISDMFHSCKKEQSVNPIKDRIKAEIKQKDSVKEVIVYRDSVRKVVVHHWHTIRKDSLIPCLEKLIICDTLIKVDSLLISDLKHEISIDDSIINNYQKVAVIDSNTIVNLKKDIRKQRNKTKLAWIVAGIFGGVAVLK